MDWSISKTIIFHWFNQLNVTDLAVKNMFSLMNQWKGKTLIQSVKIWQIQIGTSQMHAQKNYLIEWKEKIYSKDFLLIQTKDLFEFYYITFVWFKKNIFGLNKYLFRIKLIFLLNKQIIALVYGQRYNLFDLRKNLFDLNKFLFGSKILFLI